MDLPHQMPRFRLLLVSWAAVVAVACCGCADMMPNSETWQKWSPANLWYRMSPDQLSRMNEGSGLPSDVYYSISDYPERDPAARPANQTSNEAPTVIKPIGSVAGSALP
jgi:hypothetical protein